jgi:hypothetical protein
MPHKNTESVLRCSLVSPRSVFVKRSHDSSSCERSYWMDIDTCCFSQLHQCYAVTVLMGFEKTNWNLSAIFPNPLQCFKGIMQVTGHYFLTGSWWSGFRGETRGGFWRQWDGGESNKIQVTRKQVEWKAKGHKIHKENTLSISLVLGNRPWRPIGLWDIKVATFSRQLTQRWQWGCQPYMLPALYPLEDSWYSFLLQAESPPGP